MKQVRKLHSELMKIVADAEGPKDTRFQSWAKVVESVDQNKTNGYAFRGEFINEGDVEIEIKPTVFLTMTTRGSRKYQTRTYNVIVMNADGTLELVTDIQTTDEERGWALRLRDPIASLLELQEGKSQTTLTITVDGEAAELWRAAKALRGESDYNLLKAALENLMENRQ